MYEKILSKLKLQRGQTSHVTDRSLEDLAKSLQTVITTDELLEKTDLSPAIASIDGNISYYTKQAVDKLKQEQEAERLKKEKELKEKEEAEKQLQDAKDKDGNTPEWVKAMMEQNRLLMEQSKQFANDLQSLKTEKVTTNRSDLLNKELNGVPDYLANPIRNSFKLAKFVNDEEFTAYLTSVKTEKDNFLQQAKEHGINFTAPGTNVKKTEQNGQTPELSEALKLVIKQKEKQNATN